MAITMRSKGSFKHSRKFLTFITDWNIERSLRKYAEKGVAALREATPKDTGKTAESWDYEFRYAKGSAGIYWINRNIQDGVNIAVILQYGHGTRNGGYVQGRDYINPAIRPVFDEIADKLWNEVTSA